MHAPIWLKISLLAILMYLYILSLQSYFSRSLLIWLWGGGTICDGVGVVVVVVAQNTILRLDYLTILYNIVPYIICHIIIIVVYSGWPVGNFGLTQLNKKIATKSNTPIFKKIATKSTPPVFQKNHNKNIPLKNTHLTPYLKKSNIITPKGCGQTHRLKNKYRLSWGWLKSSIIRTTYI